MVYDSISQAKRSENFYPKFGTYITYDTYYLNRIPQAYESQQTSAPLPNFMNSAY